MRYDKHRKRTHQPADVAEPVYALVSKTGPDRVVGSSPTIGTYEDYEASQARQEGA